MKKDTTVCTRHLYNLLTSHTVLYRSVCFNNIIVPLLFNLVLTVGYGEQTEETDLTLMVMELRISIYEASFCGHRLVTPRGFEV